MEVGAEEKSAMGQLAGHQARDHRLETATDEAHDRTDTSDPKAHSHSAVEVP